jgi:hypothetical protein
MVEVPSSSRVVLSIRAVGGALRAFCSFCGGAGRSSTGVASAVTSPKGPSGPSESSSASRVVDWVPKRREGRVLDGALLTLDRVLSGTAGVSVSVSVSAVEGVGSVVEVVWSSWVAWAARLLLECDRDGTSAVRESANVLTRGAQSHSPPQGESSSMAALSECCEWKGPGCFAHAMLPVPSPRRNTPSLAPSPSPSDHYRLPSIDITSIMHFDLQSRVFSISDTSHLPPSSSITDLQHLRFDRYAGHQSYLIATTVPRRLARRVRQLLD